jgi:hypothetical protein
MGGGKGSSLLASLGKGRARFVSTKLSHVTDGSISKIVMSK